MLTFRCSRSLNTQRWQRKNKTYYHVLRNQWWLNITIINNCQLCQMSPWVLWSAARRENCLAVLVDWCKVRWKARVKSSLRTHSTQVNILLTFMIACEIVRSSTIPWAFLSSNFNSPAAELEGYSTVKLKWSKLINSYKRNTNTLKVFVSTSGLQSQGRRPFKTQWEVQLIINK